MLIKVKINISLFFYRSIFRYNNGSYLKNKKISNYMIVASSGKEVLL